MCSAQIVTSPWIVYVLGHLCGARGVVVCGMTCLKSGSRKSTRPGLGYIKTTNIEPLLGREGYLYLQPTSLLVRGLEVGLCLF